MRSVEGLKILVVEDEKDLNHIISKRLKQEGNLVESCYDGETALDYMIYGAYDAIILDIMLPKISGIEILKKRRSAEDDTPILLLTAKDSISDRVLGLDCGADDYLVKPFAFEELMARLRLITRRVRGKKVNRVTLADLSLDCTSHVVKRGEKIINLSAKEFSILEYMMRNQGIVLSREKIENNIWDLETMGASNVIDVYIRYLRKKIDDGYEPKLIHTVRGIGYVMRIEE